MRKIIHEETLKTEINKILYWENRIPSVREVKRQLDSKDIHVSSKRVGFYLNLLEKDFVKRIPLRNLK